MAVISNDYPIPQRVILYRGKSTYNGKWVYGSIIVAPGYCCILQDDDDLPPCDQGIYLDGDLGTIDGKATPVIPETVSQYIELNDKNNRRIFEKDVIRICGSEVCYLVSFENGSYVCANRVKCEWFFHRLKYDCNDSYEVVGNLFDNPDMLQ